MTSCSRRRKTKHPFCKDDPKCYWNKTCKSRSFKEHSFQNSEKLSKLDTIIKKLDTIENKIKLIEKNTSKTVKKTSSSFKSKHNKKHGSRPKTKSKSTSKTRNSKSPFSSGIILNAPNNNKKETNKTASLNKVNKLMNNIHNNENTIRSNENTILSNSRNTVSPDAVQRLIDL